MTPTINRLMLSNLLEVFNERDPERRRAAITRTYAPDVRWTDDDGVQVGHEALDAKAAELQRNIGPLQFIAAGPVHETTGFGYLAWHLVAERDQTPQVSGFDVAIIRDDVISELYTVLTSRA
ncbi:nuclear transport factor 2 family protein [Mycolicibacterium moriokaense]|nr:nuclear transport factor 2 family protein [Mycolicibacterium moriokaense]